MSYLRVSSDKSLKFVNRKDIANFEKKHVTLGQLGINRYSKLTVGKELNTSGAMAEVGLKLNHQQYIQFND